MSMIKRRMELEAEFGHLDRLEHQGKNATLSRQFLRTLPIICNPNYARSNFITPGFLLVTARDVLRHCVMSVFGPLSFKVDTMHMKWEVELCVSSGITLKSFDFARPDTTRDPNEVFRHPLFAGLDIHPNKKEIEGISRGLTKMYADFATNFWRDWYQGFLDGTPLDWELQRRVALIPDEDWEKGPEHIARKIEEIKAQWLSEQAPSAEKIEFDEAAQKFQVIPLEIAKPDLLGATLSQIEDALDDVLACPSNGLHDGSKAVRVLRRTLTKYGNNPQQIEMGLVTAHTAITRQFLADEMPQSEENLALRDAIEDGARGIRATHPEVAENRKILQDQALREMSQDDLDLLEDAKPMLEAWSAEDLAEDWAHDIPQLINDAITPLPSGAPPLPGAEEATRIFSRAAKMKLSYDAIVSSGASAFDSKTMKTVRLGLTLGGVLSALVGMGLRVFGLI